MKAFASALAFYAALMVLTGLAFEYAFSLTATEAYSLDSVRVGHDLPVTERPGFGKGL